MHKVSVTSTHTVTLLLVQSDGQTQPATPSSVVPVRDNVPEGVWRVLDGNSLGGGSGVRPAFTGAEINAVAALNQPSGVASVNRVETGTPHGLPLGVDRDPDGDLSTAMQEADDWASQQNSDPLQTATQLMATPSAALARCLGMGVRRAAAAGPSDFEIQLLAAERAAPPRLERITARVYTPLKAALKIDSIAIEPPQQWEPPEVEAPLAVAVLRPAAPVRPRFGRTTVGKWGARMPRRHPLNLVTARAGTEPIATQLYLAPAKVDASTAGTNIVGRDRSQRFARVGTTLEFRRTFEGSARSAAFLDGLQAALETGAPLRAGQVHVWHFLRAAEDTRKNRPSLSVTGNQAVRFVALDRVGGVLVDKTIDKEDVAIPKGTHRVAVIGTGTDPTLPARGMAGWHAGATVLQVQSNTYLVAGGVLRATSPDTLRRRRPVDTALVSGSVAVRGRGISETELPGDTSCVLVALRPRPGADPAASELLLGLDGTKQVRDSTGEPLPPLVVIEGDRVHLLYAVVPQKKGPLTVSVGRDEDWMLEGVLGSPRSPESVARWLVELGIDGLAAALANANNLRSTVTWKGAAP
jgi:hypothetical protein